MGFTSYAQNFEDVMLWRALGHVKDGLYIDVGAQHPRIDSISRAFYERGWRGVHIEPVPTFADMLRQDRPDETVLQVALGEREGTLALNVFADTGLSTAIASYAERHQIERNYQVQRIEVPMLTLRTALGSVAGKQVHWLKIDVEGFEEQVLRGWDSQQLRPWILVIEATIPNSAETDYDKWDHLVTGAGYRFVYFDGLNRFYIADEHPELAAAFAAPPNVFDTVEVSGLASWGLCNLAVADHQARIRELEASETAANARIKALEDEAADRAEQLVASTTFAADAQARLEAVEAKLNERDRQFRITEQDLGASKADVQRLKHEAYYWWHTAEELRRQLGQLQEELRMVYNSKSWRLSTPLRIANAQGKRARSFAARAARWALRQPGRVRRTMAGQAAPAAVPSQPGVVVVSRPAVPVASRRLSPRAARLYSELKQLVEKGTD